jgi:hypothetical protein
VTGPGSVSMAADTAAVMVTHDGERFVHQQCESIFGQNLLPAVLVIVDDASSDASRSLLREIAHSAPIPVELIFRDGSDAPDLKTRVASSVVNGLAAVTQFDFVLLADQDDEWLIDRLASQRAILSEHAGAMLVAGDGVLIDDAGNLIGGRISDQFPPPADWDALDAAGRARAALSRPLVTGAAAAMTRELAELMMPVPRGWLHDRWATLVAVAVGGLVLQQRPVINYRVHGDQVLGLRQANVGSGHRRWRQVVARGTSPVMAVLHARDVVRHVRPLATDPAIQAELSWSAVLRTAADRD